MTGCPLRNQHCSLNYPATHDDASHGMSYTTSDAALTPARAVTIPEGWILMPAKPTEEMLAEANERSLSTDVLMDDTPFACVTAMWEGLVAKRPAPPEGDR
jgi:hypothetical protein